MFPATILFLLDVCSSLLTGLPSCTLGPLQWNHYVAVRAILLKQVRSQCSFFYWESYSGLPFPLREG